MRFIVKSILRVQPSVCNGATMYAYVAVQNLQVRRGQAE